MPKPVIGIMSRSSYMETDDMFQDKYMVQNQYVHSVVRNGGIPLPIPYDDEQVIPEVLDMCDGLMIPGGNRIRPVFFDVIRHFDLRKKPILGICMGMQALAAYFYNLEHESPARILIPVDTGVNHAPVYYCRATRDVTVHDISIEPGTQLYRIFNAGSFRVNSIHMNMVGKVAQSLAVSARSPDGVIEGIELKDPSRFALGVQFHAELREDTNCVIAAHADACRGSLQTRAQSRDNR